MCVKRNGTVHLIPAKFYDFYTKQKQAEIPLHVIVSSRSLAPMSETLQQLRNCEETVA